MQFVIRLFIISNLFLSSVSASLSKSLVPLTDKNVVCKIWVIFKDKKPDYKSSVSSKALLRRGKVDYQDNESDLNISENYIRSVEGCGAKLHHVFKWENAASFILLSANLEKVAALPFVKEVTPVGSCTQRVPNGVGALQKRKNTIDQAFYGSSFDQLNIVNIPSAHKYLLEDRHFNAPGENVLIAFFDGGFRLDHQCLKSVRQGHLKAAYDFIDNDTSVSDPDSVVNNPGHPYYHNDEHGSEVLSLVAGYDPGKLMGVAWGAQFALARTENTFYNVENTYEVEVHSEEDDWAAAVVWAESLGVDIISSSLGYRDGFQDSVTILNGDTIRRVVDYSYNDMNGKTTIVSRAALGAVQRGMIVVNAMGNEGANVVGTITAPADVDGVISVGALNFEGTGIARFSSTGPTADGRIKPDLVVPGEFVTVPSIYGNSKTYFQQSGTSFSAPVVAGICALIVQSLGKNNFAYSSSNVRDRLFNSCKLLQGQIAFDNTYGRGLPDAFDACRAVQETTAVCFNLFPNVIKPGTARRVTFITNKRDDDIMVKLRVLSVDGKLVWKNSSLVKASDTVITTWECKNGNGVNLIPGIYFVVFESKGKVYKNKMLIAG